MVSPTHLAPNVRPAASSATADLSDPGDGYGVEQEMWWPHDRVAIVEIVRKHVGGNQVKREREASPEKDEPPSKRANNTNQKYSIVVPPRHRGPYVVKSDGDLTEVVSPILYRIPGGGIELEPLKAMLRDFVRGGAQFPLSAGLHVHVGAARLSPANVLSLYALAVQHQDALYPLLGVHRNRKTMACMPLDPSMVRAALTRPPQTRDALVAALGGSNEDSRNYFLNICNYVDEKPRKYPTEMLPKNTVEIRIFNGTGDARLLGAYVGLALALKQYAVDQGTPPRPEAVDRPADIFQFLDALGMVEGNLYRQLLLDRWTAAVAPVSPTILHIAHDVMRDFDLWEQSNIVFVALKRVPTLDLPYYVEEVSTQLRLTPQTLRAETVTVCQRMSPARRQQCQSLISALERALAQRGWQIDFHTLKATATATADGYRTALAAAAQLLDRSILLPPWMDEAATPIALTRQQLTQCVEFLIQRHDLVTPALFFRTLQAMMFLTSMTATQAYQLVNLTHQTPRGPLRLAAALDLCRRQARV